ncbi:MAG TPA: DUF2520 domain-containing protein [Flavobacteriaceae bacterium]|nr:DUF2520 domain-containing protein [Flavobacteriaceae bacterium]
MQKIVILGAGNIAFHLFKTFQSVKDFEVVQIYNRSEPKLKDFEGKVETTTDINQLKSADIYIVAVSDDGIKKLIDAIHKNQTALIVHTSGSTPMLSSAERNGVFYPLQTFSKQKEPDFSKIPICIEADTSEDLKLLEKIGKSISEKVYLISSDQRKSLHLAAVFACNFTNQLYQIAEKICEEKEMPFEILHALILETAQKVQYDSPKNVQTGPAKRGDQETIDFHLSQLDSPELKEIYTLLTESIQREHGSEL